MEFWLLDNYHIFTRPIYIYIYFLYQRLIHTTPSMLFSTLLTLYIFLFADNIYFQYLYKIVIFEYNKSNYRKTGYIARLNVMIKIVYQYRLIWFFFRHSRDTIIYTTLISMFTRYSRLRLNTYILNLHKWLSS